MVVVTISVTNVVNVTRRACVAVVDTSASMGDDRRPPRVTAERRAEGRADSVGLGCIWGRRSTELNQQMSRPLSLFLYPSRRH